jgi:hypothetical protein
VLFIGTRPTLNPNFCASDLTLGSSSQVIRNGPTDFDIRPKGVKPVTDPGHLYGGWPEEDDLDDFLEEIYTARLI